MKVISNRKKIELLILPVVIGVFYFFTSSVDIISLFSFGYIWNWTCSIDLDEVYSGKKNRFSLMRFIVSLHKLFLRPFNNSPALLKRLVSILPAGVFWFLIVFIYDSQMPVWAPFLGSLIFELVSLEVLFVSKEKDKQ